MTADDQSQNPKDAFAFRALLARRLAVSVSQRHHRSAGVPFPRHVFSYITVWSPSCGFMGSFQLQRSAKDKPCARVPGINKDGRARWPVAVLIAAGLMWGGLVTVKRERRSSVDADGCGTRTEGTFIRLIHGVVLVGAPAIYERRNVLSFRFADKAIEKQQGTRRFLMRRTLFSRVPRRRCNGEECSFLKRGQRTTVKFFVCDVDSSLFFSGKLRP